MTAADRKHWDILIGLCLGNGTVKAIRDYAAGMKEVQMPRSEWDNPKSPFVLLKGAAKLINGRPESRAEVVELAKACRAILVGAGSPGLGDAVAMAFRPPADQVEHLPATHYTDSRGFTRRLPHRKDIDD